MSCSCFYVKQAAEEEEKIISCFFGFELDDEGNQIKIPFIGNSAINRNYETYLRSYLFLIFDDGDCFGRQQKILEAGIRTRRWPDVGGATERLLVHSSADRFPIVSAAELSNQQRFASYFVINWPITLRLYSYNINPP